MEHLSPPTNADSESMSRSATTLSDTSRNAVPRKWIDALFQRFANIWPRDWADKCAHGNLEGIVQEWSLGLAGLTGEVIGQAIDYCRRHMHWSPSIAEFREAVKQGMTDEQYAMQARMQEVESERRALPARTWAESRAAGAKYSQAIRQNLKTRVSRTQPNIEAGLWTREMEARFAEDCRLLGIPYQEPEWPEPGLARNLGENASEAAQDARGGVPEINPTQSKAGALNGAGGAFVDSAGFRVR